MNANICHEEALSHILPTYRAATQAHETLPRTWLRHEQHFVNPPGLVQNGTPAWELPHPAAMPQQHALPLASVARPDLCHRIDSTIASPPGLWTAMYPSATANYYTMPATMPMASSSAEYRVNAAAVAHPHTEGNLREDDCINPWAQPSSASPFHQGATMRDHAVGQSCQPSAHLCFRTKCSQSSSQPTTLDACCSRSDRANSQHDHAESTSAGMPCQSPRLSGPVRRAEIPVSRLQSVHEFVKRNGRRPTRNSSDAEEKRLGIWLHRFTSNDDGVKDRARQWLNDDEFEAMVTFIEHAPHVKQVANRSIALANIEQIARHVAAFNALPLRNDPSGCGRKLHNIRQGRLAPELRDEAHVIVHRILGDAPERANLLRNLQATIEMSVARHAFGSHGSSHLRQRNGLPQSVSTPTSVRMQAIPVASSVATCTMGRPTLSASSCSFGLGYTAFPATAKQTVASPQGSSTFLPTPGPGPVPGPVPVPGPGPVQVPVPVPGPLPGPVVALQVSKVSGQAMAPSAAFEFQRLTSAQERPSEALASEPEKDCCVPTQDAPQYHFQATPSMIEAEHEYRDCHDQDKAGTLSSCATDPSLVQLNSLGEPSWC